MALEAYLGKLTKTGEGGRRTLREYHPKSLVDATSVLETIKGANLETEEGLKGYSQLTGINPAKYSLRELEFFKRGQIKEVSRDLGAYVNGHFPKVVGELSEEEQIRQAINSSPECKLSSGSSEGAKKYDRARGHISQAMGIMEMIQERPREVLKHELETGSSLVGRYILENAAEYLGILNEEAKDKDWVVVGSSPEEMAAKGFRPIGKDFPVFLHPETNEEYALARTEKKVSKGYHGFKFFASPEITLEEDLKRRDITINAIAEDEDGAIYDPYNGLEDIKNKVKE